METSWALGAGYHLLNTYHEEQRQRRQQQQSYVIVRESRSNDTTSGTDYLFDHMREFVYKPINVIFSFLNLISS